MQEVRFIELHTADGTKRFLNTAWIEQIQMVADNECKVFFASKDTVSVTGDTELEALLGEISSERASNSKRGPNSKPNRKPQAAKRK